MILVAMAAVFLVGCASPWSGRLPTFASEEEELDAGYTLLRELLNSEAQVDGILILKNASPEVETLLEEVAVACVEMRDEIDSMAWADNRLALRATGLPKVETGARDRITSETASALLGSRSTDFELRILLSQEQAMSYGRHLADALADVEPDPARVKIFKQMATTMKNFHERIMAILLARYGSE